MSDHLSVENAFNVLTLAFIYNCKLLVDCADLFIRRNFLEIVDHETFLCLGIVCLVRIAESTQLYVRSEDEVFDAIRSWLEHRFSERAPHMHKLLSAVRLNQLSRSCFAEVQSFEACKNCPKCQEIISNSKENGPELRSMKRCCCKAEAEINFISENSATYLLGSWRTYVTADAIDDVVHVTGGTEANTLKYTTNVKQHKRLI